MAATAKDVHAAHVPDEFRRCSDTFSNGVTVDGGEEEEEPEVEVNSDSNFEQVAAEEENAGVAASKSDGKMAATTRARVQKKSSRSGGAARHGDEEEVSGDCNVKIQHGLLERKRKATDKPRTSRTEIHDEKCHGERNSEDNYVQAGGGLQRRKRKATVTPSKPQRTTTQDKSAQGECMCLENEILGLKLELKLKNKEIKSLKKQIGELKAENEHYRKIAKPPRTPRLCRFCNKYVLGHDYRNCPERRASASSEQDEGDDSE